MSFKKIFYNKYLFLILIIILVGTFLRTYHYSDNFFFEFDQARDWNNALKAYENGPDELPLIGPRAGGTLFRLGPIYVYFQYLSMLLFGKAPYVIGYFDLIFSILSIPLFYFLLREYFAKNISVILIALYAFSLFSIEYSRFAWNPNSIPFFSLSIGLSLLKLSKEKNHKWRWIYVILLSFALGVIVQLHTLTMIVFPILIIIYLLWTRTRLFWKEILATISIIIFLLSPIIINDTLNNYTNITSFFQALKQKEDSQSDITPDKKIVKGFYEISKNYLMILTSHEFITKMILSQKSPNAAEMIKANLKNIEGKTNFLLFSIFLIIYCIILFHWILLIYLSKNTDVDKINFLKLMLIWQVIVLIPFIVLSYNTDTRHYLMAIFLPFVALGYLMNYLIKKGQIYKIMVAAFIVILIVINLWGVKKWLTLLENYKKDINYSNYKEFVLESYYKVTLNQIESVSKYLKSEYDKNNREMRLISRVEYQRPIIYYLQNELKVPIYFDDQSLSDYGRLYYFLDIDYDPEKRLNDLPEKVNENFKVTSYKKFGNVAIYNLAFKNPIPENYSLLPEVYDYESNEYQKKYYWKEIIN
jgi:4-amino-4-deoxy-L-arabinose transferase-like glycosyltransferase